MNLFIEGFLLQASLIFALGAQNLFVLESGLRRRHPVLVASVCSTCDAILIALGVYGAATIFLHVPALKILFGILGVGFLFYYGALKLKEAYRPGAKGDTHTEISASAKRSVILALSFSLLNPHVYLDTVILIGGYSTNYHKATERGLFGIGAASFSTFWFFSLALSSAKMSRFLQSPKSMRWVALISGLILVVLSIKLGRDVYGWIRQN